MSEDAPLFSVMMPAYNMEAYIVEAVESVRAQDRPDVELLIVDDGSEDGTPAALDAIRAIGDPRIRIWRQENAGKSAALNRMLHEARGRYVALLDADDLCHPERFSRAAEHFAAAPDLPALMTGHELIVDGRLVAPRAQARDRAECRAEIDAYRMPAHDPTLICAREVALTLGGFAEDMRRAMGLDFVLRLGEVHPIEVIGEPLYRYRVTPGSLTRSDLERRATAVRTAMDRARVRRGVAPFTDAEFSSYYAPLARDPTNNLIGHFTDSAYLLRAAGDRAGALRTAAAAFRAVPFGPKSFKPMIYAVAPMTLAKAIRRREATKAAGRPPGA